MKSFAAYILMFIPIFSFGQLFPTVPEFKGNVESVVEIRYGKEDKSLSFLERIFRPAVLSGWKYTFQFDARSHLLKRINTYQNEIRSEYVYKRDSTPNRLIQKEINTLKNDEQVGDYMEYENFFDSSGQIIKVNYFAFTAKERKRELFQIDQDTEYRNGRLISFFRQPVNENGENPSGEKCSLFYNSLGELSRIERKDLGSGFSTVINYSYSQGGIVSHFSVDFLIELQEYGKKDQVQDILFKYDSRGNWIRKYWKADTQYFLEAKRRIKYQ